MPIFLLFAGGLCAATVLLLWRTGKMPQPASDDRNTAGIAVYSDQLRELEGDLASGAITAAEAEGQRIEISRLVLAASRAQGAHYSAAATLPRWLVLAVPVLAGLLYVQLGKPQLADVPRQGRLAAARTAIETMQKGAEIDPATIDWPAGMALIEDRLAENPDDVDGWRILIPNYLNAGRYGAAAEAYANVIRLSGPTADLYANLAEALVYENKGLVTTQSVAVNREALKRDARHPKALYYEGLGLAQQGKPEDAKAIFTKLLAESADDAPWRAAVERELARLSTKGTAPQISDEQVQGAQNMTQAERTAMIRSMVDGLDTKLKTSPDDIEGWLRLIRARMVLGESTKATEALATARQIFAGNSDRMKSLADLAKELDVQ